jgi:alkaline phosphatase D
MSKPNRREFIALTAAGLVAAACGEETDPVAEPLDQGMDAGLDADRPDAEPPDAELADAAAPDAAPPLPEAPPVDLEPGPALGGDPWTLGVASGDPLAEAVVIWTRLAPDPVAEDGLGGMPRLDVEVLWELAADPDFAHVVRRDVFLAVEAEAWSVHVDVDGLRPDRWWWYRFRVGSDGPWSPVGRARTTPAIDSSPEGLRFASTTCQHFETAHYAAHRHLAEAEIDLLFFVGDYIYEGGGRPGLVRQHLGGTAQTLANYRQRYGQYKADPHLQASHAACPWVITWDDHEYSNNYAGGADVEDLTRRAAAYRAWWEHQPVRVAAPESAHLQIYRRFAWGDLFDCWVLDTRQYRDAQPCGGEIGPACEGLDDPERSILGAEQRDWLIGGLTTSTARWRVLAQQVLMMDITLNGSVVNPDQWDGYRDERAAVFGAAVRDEVNLMVLTGDAHAAAMATLNSDARDHDSPQVGVEVMTTSISSKGIGDSSLNDTLSRLARVQRHIYHFNASLRGFALFELGRDDWQVQFQVVEDSDDSLSALSTERHFSVDRTGTITELA